jgi:hypothetical protein
VSASAGPPVHVVWTEPAPEATGISPGAPIRFQLDRMLAPDTAVRQSICVTSASVGSRDAGFTRCTGAVLAPQYDPVDRVATFELTSPLSPSTRYNAVLLRPESDNDPNGVRAIDGAVLEESFVLPFWTGSGTTPAVQPRRSVGFCDDLGPFAILRGCAAGGSCHGAGPVSGPPPYGAAFLLDTPDGGLATAVRSLVERGTVATETATGPDPARPQRRIFGPFAENMPYIDPKNPANSYLLYKLMIGMDEQTAPPLLPPEPGERERLRARIHGAPMPPGATTPRSWAETLSAWIAGGAEAEPCP